MSSEPVIAESREDQGVSAMQHDMQRGLAVMRPLDDG